MFLTRIDPFVGMDRIFNDWVTPFPTLNTIPRFDNKSADPVRITTAQDGTEVIEFDVPGMDKKDLQLRYSDDVLSVQTEFKEKTDKSSHRRFVSYKIYVPGLDIENIEASCEKGILTVTAKPKTPNQIAIKIK